MFTFAQNAHYELRIDPGTSSVITVQPGGTVQFTAKAFEMNPVGAPIEVQIDNLHWSVSPASLGTITQQGLFTASTSQNTTSRGTVIAVATIGRVSVQAAVTLLIGNQSQPQVTFTGNVRSSTGPIHAATVSVMSTSMLPFLKTGKTNAQGDFSINVPSGSYIVRADAHGYGQLYYDNVSEAQQAYEFVTDPNTPVIGNIDFLLTELGIITGSVVDAATNAPIEAALVTAIPTSTGGSASNRGYHAQTDAHGMYRLAGLPQGEYIVFANHHAYAIQYYDNETELTNADVVNVVDGQTRSGIDFALGQRGAISGLVVDATTNAPIEGVLVSAISSGTGGPATNRGYHARTDAHGVYQITGIEQGDYIVSASHHSYAIQYYDNTNNPSSADVVSVLEGQTTSGIDFRLGQLGSISGLVVDAMTNTPIEGALVSAMPSGGSGTGANRGTHAVTDAHGMYRLAGLTDGEYIVSAGKHGYIQQYYNGVTIPANATPVVVLNGQTTSNIDFALGILGAISGLVVNESTNAPIEGVLVSAVPRNAVGHPSNRSAHATTDAHGAYVLIGLNEGDYTVSARKDGYGQQYYDGEVSISNATPVTVELGKTTGGINFALDAFDGSIAGIVKDENANPISGATVSAWINGRPASNTSRSTYGRATTAVDGSYIIEGLPKGDYIVRAEADNFIAEYYDTVYDIQSATVVNVATQPVTGIDFVLGQAGGISGAVSSLDPNSVITRGTVIVRSVTQHFERGARTDAQGAYHVSGLPSGTYIVFATAAQHIGEYYDGVNDPSQATQIIVTAPGIVTNIDFALSPAPIRYPRNFSGVVQSNSNGLPPDYTLVEAINPDNGERIVTGVDAHGSFSFYAWENAVIRARAIGHVGMYAGNTWNWKESIWAGFVGGMNIALDPVSPRGMADVSGYVTEAGSGAALAEAWVYGIDPDGNMYFSVTGPDGAFLLEHATNGSLDILVSEVMYETRQVETPVNDARGNAGIVVHRSSALSAPVQAPLPASVILHQNYPNPFNPSTTISYTMRERAHVRLSVYTLQGKEVARLVDEVKEGGTYNIVWDAAILPSGTYVYRLQSGPAVQMRMMSLIK